VLRGPQSPDNPTPTLSRRASCHEQQAYLCFGAERFPDTQQACFWRGCVWGRSALTPLALARVRLEISREHPDPKMAEKSTEPEVLAQQLAHLGHKIESLETRVTEVEAVIPRLERAAETTARALEEVSAHWDAVYRAMRRAE
jgi:hypothetical protein